MIKVVKLRFNIKTNITKEEIEIYEQQRMPEIVKSSCKNTNIVLNKVVRQSTTILTYLDQIITQMDDEIGNKYQWNNIKRSLNTYQNNYIGQQLDDYIKEDVMFF